MKFYLAGRYEDLLFLRDVAFLLIHSGHTVTSRWLRGETPAPTLPEELQTVAEQDLEDIRAADCFVLYNHTTPPLPTRQGHSVELGYALGLNSANGNYGLPNVAVAMVGERTTNVFHYHGAVQHHPTWQEFFEQHKIVGQLLQGGPHATPAKS